MADEFSESIAIVYPAHWGYTDVQFPHSTILYLGEIPDVDFGKDILVDTLDSLKLELFMWAEVIGKERFGAEQDVPVLLIEHSKLQPTYELVSSALYDKGISSASEFDYRPHVTVGDGAWENPPTNIMLSPPVVWWGDDR